MLNEKYIKAQKDWYNENQPLGKALGYPDCCIKAFCDLPPEIIKFAGTKANAVIKSRYAAACLNGKFTGFIPCYPHAKEILQKKITLASLIKNRDKSFPAFPIYAQY